MKVDDVPKISQLSIAEKILFVEELWDSISSFDSEIPIPNAHKDELNKRHKKYLNLPGALLSLNELQARIEKEK